MRHGDGGEDGSERSPYSAYFAQTLSASDVYDHGRRKAEESERDVSSRIAVETAPGAGTTFRILFPAITESARADTSLGSLEM